MRKYLFSLCLLLLAFNNQAQVCEIPNGNLEVWVDHTPDFEELAEIDLPAETLIAPEGFVSGLRFISILFSSFFDNLGTDNIPGIVSSLFGTQRSTDSSEGEFALRLGADNLFPLADLVSVGACNGSQPVSFSIDLKHVGNTPDTLTIFGVFGESTGLPEDLEQLDDYSAFFLEQVINDASTEYQTISIPITDTGNEIVADSFTLFILLSSNEENISMGDTSYYLIDNLQFQGEGNTTAIQNFSLPNQVELYPTLFNHNITINNDNDPLEAILYSSDGKRKAALTIPQGQSDHDLSFITNSGTYLLKMVDPKTKRSVTKMILKQ